MGMEKLGGSHDLVVIPDEEQQRAGGPGVTPAPLPRRHGWCTGCTTTWPTTALSCWLLCAEDLQRRFGIACAHLGT
jgi:hypothetical protein